MMTRGRMTTPGLIVENWGKNWTMARKRKNLDETEYKLLHVHRTRDVYAQVGYAPELLQQISRKKSDDGVL